MRFFLCVNPTFWYLFRNLHNNMFKYESSLQSCQEKHILEKILIMVLKVPEETQPAYASGNTADIPEENNTEER